MRIKGSPSPLDGGVSVRVGSLPAPIHPLVTWSVLPAVLAGVKCQLQLGCETMAAPCNYGGKFITEDHREGRIQNRSRDNRANPPHTERGSRGLGK